MFGNYEIKGNIFYRKQMMCVKNGFVVILRFKKEI